MNETQPTPWGLTAREVDVMEALCVYGTNEATASALSISPAAVVHHLQGVRRRMGVDDRLIMALTYQRWSLTRQVAPAVERKSARRRSTSQNEGARRAAIMAAVLAAPDTGITLTELRGVIRHDLRITLFRMRAEKVLPYLAISPARIIYYPTEVARDAAAQAMAESPGAPHRRGGAKPVVRNAILAAIAAAPEDLGIEAAAIESATSLDRNALKATLCRLRRDGWVSFLKVSGHRFIYFSSEAARDAAAIGMPQRLAAERAAAHPPKPPKAPKPPRERKANWATLAPSGRAKPAETGMVPPGDPALPPGFKTSVFPTPRGRYEVTEPITSGFASMGIGRYLGDDKK